MKPRILLATLSLALAAAAPAASRWTSESPLEQYVVGDFDGDSRDDLAVVDKASGSFRVGLQTAAQFYTWRQPASAGFSNVTSVASGRLMTNNADALAFTSPEANRINILSLASPSAPWSVANRYPTNHGLTTLAALDLGGAGNNTTIDDLYLGSMWDGSPGLRHSTWRNTLATLTALGAGAVNGRPERANAVTLKTGLPQHSTVILRSNLLDVLLVSSNYSGVPQISAQTNIPAGGDYLAASFETASSLARFVVWVPGQSNLHRYPVAEPSANSFRFNAPTTFNLGVPIDGVFALPGTPGYRLLVLHHAGAQSSVYAWDGTVAAPSLLFRTNAPEGETFSGAIPLGDFGFMSLSSHDGTGRTTTARPTRWSGTGYTNGAAVSLPSLDHFAGQANVLLFGAEPFVSPNPTLLARRSASDWSSGVRATPSVTATQETFATSQTGVGAPVSVNLGATPVGATLGLGNQVSNFMSLFSLTQPLGEVVSDVRIDPVPGAYDAAVTVTLSSKTAGHQIWYRVNHTGNWSLYSAPLILSATTTLSYYGKPAAGTARSVVRTALFTITRTPASLDSDGDGVPDYVESSKGLDPTLGGDSDSDSWSDLEELVYGSNPNNASSQPASNSPPVSLSAGFRLDARPKPRDPLSDAVVKAEYGTVVHLHQISGTFLDDQTVELPAERAARFSNVVADASQRLLALATEAHFDIETTNADTRLGRELLTLVPVPSFTPIVISNSAYTGLNALADASNWIAAAQLAVTGAAPRLVEVDFYKFDTLSALLTEKKLGDLLFQRGINWGTNLTLFPHRPSDATRSNATLEVLRGLEDYAGSALPAYRLKGIYETIDAGVEAGTLTGVNALKTLVSELYRLSMLSNNAAPGTYPLPADVLRRFLAGGPIHSNYAAGISFTSNQIASARAGVSNLLAAPQPRLTTNVLLRLRPDNCGDGLRPLAQFDNLSGAGMVRLIDDQGQPFTVPEAFALLPGSELSVLAFTDPDFSNEIPATCRSNALQVILAGLLAVPAASDPDQNGNLLVDTWEEQFLGRLLNNPFADTDGDGYQDLQEMLAGTDPQDAAGFPAEAAVSFTRPAMRAHVLPSGEVALRWTWPAQYASSFVFGLRITQNLSVPFGEVATAATHVGDEFVVLVPALGLPRGFYRLSVQLR